MLILKKFWIFLDTRMDVLNRNLVTCQCIHRLYIITILNLTFFLAMGGGGGGLCLRGEVIPSVPHLCIMPI